MLDTKKPIVTINLTPLVDVSLVLVVIFMATAPMFMQSGIVVSSGQKKTNTAVDTQASQEKNIVIKLERDEIWLNEKKVATQDLSGWLRPMLAAASTKRVIIQPARDVRHGHMVQVMDIAKQSGAGSLVILEKTGSSVEGKH